MLRLLLEELVGGDAEDAEPPKGGGEETQISRDVVVDDFSQEGK